MKYILTLLSCATLLSCSEANKPIKATKPEVTVIQTTIPDSTLHSGEEVLQEEIGQEQVECVFDTSTYKFTTEALRKYDKNLKFYWDKKSSEALVKLSNSDSLILSIGGCSHFGYSATYVTHGSKFNDREFLIQKAKWLAKNFFSNGFDEKYVYCIENNLYQLEEPNRKDFFWYNIIDQDTAMTNDTYNGWTIEKVGDRVRVEISGYVI